MIDAKGMVYEYTTAVFSEYKDKALKIAGILFGDAGSPPASGRTTDSIQPLGLLSRPRDPETDSTGRPTLGAGLITATDGHEFFGAPTTDSRVLDQMPPLDKGGTQLHSSGEKVGFVYLNGTTGGLLVLIPSDEDGKNHAISIDPVGKSIQIRHKDGMGIAITGGGKNSTVINNKAGDAYIEINDDGVTINGNLTQNGAMAQGPGSVAVATIADLAAIKAQIAGLQAPPGTAGGPLVNNIPAVTPGSSQLSATPG